MFLTLEQIQAGFDAGENRGCRWYRALLNVTFLRFELDEDRFPYLPMLQICKFGDRTNLQISDVRIRAAKLLFRGIERHALALHRLMNAFRRVKKLKGQLVRCANANRIRVTHHMVTNRRISVTRAHFSMGAIFVQIIAQAEALFDEWKERFSVFTHRILREINERWMQLNIKAVLRKLSWDVPDRHWVLVVNSLRDEGHPIPAWLQ